MQVCRQRRPVFVSAITARTRFTTWPCISVLISSVTKAGLFPGGMLLWLKGDALLQVVKVLINDWLICPRVTDATPIKSLVTFYRQAIDIDYTVLFAKLS